MFLDYLGVEFFHADQIYRLQTMTIWSNKVKACVNTRVMESAKASFDLELLLHHRIMINTKTSID
jgi:hypothetical protein